MVYKKIIYSTVLCLLLTFLFGSIYRPNSSVIFPSIALQLVAFFIMILAAIIVKNILPTNQVLTLLLSFIISYIILIIILWRINAGEFISLIQRIHKDRDFMVVLFPYIYSNILLIVYNLFSKK